MRHPGSGSHVMAEQTILAREQAEALHDEIDRLPRAFRLPVVLCYFEGLTLDEAARRLRCPAGTLRSRLARARDKLRGGLARRGVILPAAALAALLDSRFASASVSSPLCDMTTRAAIRFTAEQAAAGSTSASAMALAQEVLKSMFVNKITLMALTCTILGAVAGAGYWNHTFAMKEEPMRNPGGQESRTEPRNEDRPHLATKPDLASSRQMIVTGRVLDPTDKPAAGVVVDIIGRPRAPEVGTDVPRSPYNLLGHGATDSDGRFRIEASRTSMASFFEVYALAAGTGTGMSWTALNPDVAQPTADVRLRPEQIGRGRRGPHPVLLPWPRGIRFHRTPMGGSSRRDPGLAKTRHHRRAGPVRIHRHRPRSRCASCPRPPLRLPAIRPEGQRTRRRQGGHAGPPAGDDHRGSCSRRRHRPADPPRGHLRKGQLWGVWRNVHN
jgi:hypothetical protein